MVSFLLLLFWVCPFGIEIIFFNLCGIMRSCVLFRIVIRGGWYHEWCVGMGSLRLLWTHILIRDDSVSLVS